MRNLTIASILSAAALFVAAPQAKANTFIESYSSADLVLDAEDTVITTIGVGQVLNDYQTEYSVGVGYAAGNGSAVAVRGNFRAFRDLGKQVTLETEVTGVYLSNTDQLVVTPEVRIRKWFN